MKLNPLIVSLTLIVVSHVAGTGCAKDAPALAPTAPTIVTVSQPLAREVVKREHFTGTLEASDSVNLQPQVTGYLEKVNFKPGQAVKRGDLLFEIDPRQYQAEFDRADSQVAVDQAAAQLAVADNRRNRGLAAKSPGAVTAADLDRYAAAEAQAKAQVMAAEANAAAAKLNLTRTRIEAPLSGLINRNAIDVGNLVKANITTLARIVAVDPIYVNFDVDEGTMLRLEAMAREGKVENRPEEKVAVYLGLTNDTSYPYKGVIDYIEPSVDSATGTRRVRGRFSNKKDILSPGLFAKIEVPIGEPRKALLVTERAVGTDQGQKYVFVVDAKQKVEYRAVTVGLLEDGLREIENGLKPDEWVIVNGVQRVRPGVTVDPKQVPMPVLAETEAAAAAPVIQTNQSSGKK